MRRKPASICQIAGMYDLVPGRPELATVVIKNLYGAMMRVCRKHLYKALAEIEQDYDNGRVYNGTYIQDRFNAKR